MLPRGSVLRRSTSLPKRAKNAGSHFFMVEDMNEYVSCHYKYACSQISCEYRYIYIYVHTTLYRFAYIYTHIHIYIYMCVYVRMHMYVYIYTLPQIYMETTQHF